MAGHRTDNKTERCLKHSAHPRKRADSVIRRDGSTISYTLKRSFRWSNESNFRGPRGAASGKGKDGPRYSCRDTSCPGIFFFVSFSIDCYKNPFIGHQKSYIRYFTTRRRNEKNNELKLSTQEGRMFDFFFLFAEIITTIFSSTSDVILLNSGLLIKPVAKHVLSAKRYNRDSRPRSQFLMPIISLSSPSLSLSLYTVLVNQYTWPAPVWPIVSKHTARRILPGMAIFFPEKGWDVNSRKGR